MTGEEQKQTIAAFSEYLNKEGVCHIILAYRSDGDLTFAFNANEDMPQAIAHVAMRDKEILSTFAMALGICARENGNIIQINNNYNEN